jgi:hypothetical protein
MIYEGLKVLCMLLGQQAGNTKYPCYMCEWDSRARIQHWEKNIGKQGYLLNLGARTFSANVLSFRRKYCCYAFILN